MKQAWFVYILECSDETYYTGVTTDIKRRVQEHNGCKGSKYTRTRVPVRLVAFREGLTRSEAYRFERVIKRQRRDRKVRYLKDFEI